MTTQKYVFSFEEMETANRSFFGNKSWICAEKYRRFLSGKTTEPAPEGYTVAASAYRLHLESNNLLSPLRQVLSELESELITRTVAEKNAYAIILGAEMPIEIAKQIAEYDYAVITSHFGDSTPRIPRSDCTIGEDEVGKAGAGKHRSIENRRTLQEVLDGVKSVWASTFTTQALADFYGQRSRSGDFLHLAADMVVPVLREIDSRSGGALIGFTNHLGLMRLTWAPYHHGEDIVGNKINSNLALIDLSNVLSGNDPIMWTILGSDFSTFGMSRGELLQIAERASIRHFQSSDPVDWEAAMDSSRTLYIVQERPCVPAIKIRDNKKIVAFSWNDPNQPPLVTGISVADMAGHGTVRHLQNLSHLDELETSGLLEGAVLINAEGAPELSVLASLKELKGIDVSLVTDEGTDLGHLAINIDDELPLVVGAEKATQISEGTQVTILGGKVYEGVHPYQIDEIDLKALPEISGRTMPRLVVSKPSKAAKYCAYPSKGIALTRQEALQQATIISDGQPLPPLLSCIYYDKVQNPELVKRIERMTEGDEITGSFETPVDAYVHHISRSFVPLARMAESVGGDADLRAYGGRLIEDPPFLPESMFPKGSFDSISNDGFLMYNQEWGAPVLETYAKIWLELWNNLGVRNVPIFIPNIANIEEWEICKSMLESYGIPIDRKNRFGDYKVQICLEPASSWYYIPEFSEAGVDAASGAWNDFRQSVELFKRDFMWIKTRGDLDSKAHLAIVQHGFDTIKECSHPFKMGSCGRASTKMTRLFVKNGAAYVGLGTGKKFLDGYMAIYEAEKELGII